MQIKITISLRCEGDIVLNHSLYESKTKDYLKILETLSDRYSHVLVVGHNPTIEETIEMLRDLSDYKILMPSCAVAHLIISIEKWSDLKNSKTTIRTTTICNRSVR